MSCYSTDSGSVILQYHHIPWVLKDTEYITLTINTEHCQISSLSLKHSSNGELVHLCRKLDVTYNKTVEIWYLKKSKNILKEQEPLTIINLPKIKI